MKMRWTNAGAGLAVEKWAQRLDEEFALRLYTARLIGGDPDLVLHGGGNVSFKGTHPNVHGQNAEALFVKASGADLASLQPTDLTALELPPLKRLEELKSLDDNAMINELARLRFDAKSPLPSVETLLHAFLPHRHIDHSHAGAVLALACQADAQDRLAQLLGDRVAIVPYIRPGFALAKAVAAVVRENPKANAVVLCHHGLVTFDDDPRTSYERHIEVVSTCEESVRKATTRYSLKPCAVAGESPDALVRKVAPFLRGQLAERTSHEDRPRQPAILEWRDADDVMQFVNSEQARKLAATAQVTTDHLVRTKPWALFVEDPQWSNHNAWQDQLKEAVNRYRRDYCAYIESHGGSLEGVDASPRVVLLPGVGALCFASTKRDAIVVADLTVHNIRTKLWSDAVGSYIPLEPNHLYDMEFHPMQRRKIDGPSSLPLAGLVVAISGGAGAIGVAVACSCAEAGAHVAITDIDPSRLDMALERIASTNAAHTAIGIHMDVTDEVSVHSGFDEIVRQFGGVDVIVPNAGIAHVAPIEDLKPEDLRKSLEVNAVGYLTFMRQGIRILHAQGIGGNIIINSSKNVFAPGKDFGAYSASKAACHQLGKVAAIELASSGIRVNMINADAVFGDKDIKSGLWETVGPARAQSRQMAEDDLPEFYRQRNLLKARVTGRHVGQAVVFFASNATPTTGATLPVDGGIAEAFPR